MATVMMTTGINLECVYNILSFMPNVDIESIDTRCRNIVRNRSAVVIQKAFKKWFNEMESSREDSRVFIKRYLPLTHRKTVADEMRESIVSTLMNQIMFMFEDMTRDEIIMYREVRKGCKEIIERCTSYCMLREYMLHNMDHMIREHGNDTRQLVDTCVMNDVSCEWLVRNNPRVDLQTVVDMTVDNDVFEYYIELFIVD